MKAEFCKASADHCWNLKHSYKQQQEHILPDAPFIKSDDSFQSEIPLN